MANPSDILKQLQDALFKQEIRDRDDVLDVPFAPYETDEDEYTTHVRIEQEVPEEEEEETVPDEEARAGEPPEEEKEAAAVGGEVGGVVPGMGGEMPGMGMGMGIEEPPKTASQIGRIYELKKIYSRLVSIESYLSTTSSVTLLKLRDYVSEAISLFEILTSNLESFKDKIDEIIVVFYEFLDIVYTLLDSYYKSKKSSTTNKVI